MKFLTRSGTTYEVDIANKLFRRIPQRDGYQRADDGEWAAYLKLGDLVPGYRAVFDLGQSKYLYTSPITILDESDENN